MNKYDCSYKICDLAAKLTDGLRGEEDEIIHGMYSFRASLSRGSHSLAKQYNPTISYNVGDVVALDGIVFISVANNNISRNPLIDRGVWAYFLNPYEKNQGKVKAYCMYQGANIINSYNIQSLAISIPTNSKNHQSMTTKFTFKFKTPFSQAPTILTGIPTFAAMYPQIQEYASKPICADINSTGCYIIHNSNSVPFNNTGFPISSSLGYPELIKGFFVVYENSENVPPE